MRPLNIAMIAACPFPANRGTPSRILRMSEALAKLGHNIHVVTYHLGNDTKTEGISIYRIPKIPYYNNFAPGPTITKLLLLDSLLFFKLRNIIKTENIDLIHAHHFEGALIGYAARARSGIRVIYDAHTTLTDELRYYGLWNRKKILTFFDYHVPKWADFSIAGSEELKQKFYSMGIPSHKIEFIPTGINPVSFANGNPSEIRNKYNLGSKKIVAYTGSIENFQGIQYLIDAMPAVLKQYEDTILLLVGDGNIKEFRNKCYELGIQDKVIFTGPEPFSKIPDYLASASVCVIPRVDCQGTPQKLTNYMVAGKAVVSFESSAKLLSDGVDGLIVKNGDIEQMANSIISILKNPELQIKLGENARRKAIEKYDWDVISREIESIYANLIEVKPVLVKSISTIN